MALNMCTMLYVSDVAAAAEFWKKVGLIEVSRQNLGETETVIFALTADGDARLQLFDIEFIRATSPEVADDVPSILFVVDDIETWHERVLAAGSSFVSEVQEMGGRKTFNFFDLDKKAFAFAGQ